MCPCSLQWNHVLLTLRGGVYFPSFWIWAGSVTCFGQKDLGSSDSVLILSLSLKRLELFQFVFYFSASSKGTHLSCYARKMWRASGRWDTWRIEVTIDQLTGSQPPKIHESPDKASRAAQPTAAAQRCRREPSQSRETTQLICRPINNNTWLLFEVTEGWGSLLCSTVCANKKWQNDLREDSENSV